MTDPDMQHRVDDCVRRWRVTIDTTQATESSLIAYGRREGRAVVLKVTRRPGDEWKSGEIVRAFGRRGMVGVIEHEDGALLLDRVDPGTQLVELSLSGRDAEATTILGRVIQSMHPDAAPSWCPTVADWGRGFARYLESGDSQIEPAAVQHAERVYRDLCATQRSPRLLHGDLQHYNVLHDRELGWIAIDPKGVIGELEYELGAAMRNPVERPSMFTDVRVARARLAILCAALGLDLQRAIAWTYTQAVLSAIWGVEDGYHVEASTPVLELARGMKSSTRA